jgi:hypothetical protein
MPTIDGRYTHVKVYRPPGTLYVEAEERRVLLGTHKDSGQIMRIVTAMAVSNAYVSFYGEFGRDPVSERTAIEVTVTTTRVIATLYELPEVEVQ